MESKNKAVKMAGPMPGCAAKTGVTGRRRLITVMVRCWPVTQAVRADMMNPRMEQSSRGRTYFEDVDCSSAGKETKMIRAAVERCAGIDVGKKCLSVCIMTGPLEGEPRVERRRYGVNVART